MKIIPSILTNNSTEAKALLSRCEDVVDRVSIDIIDGKFADNKTIDLLALQGIETNLKLDFQLMVIDPVNWVKKCTQAGAHLRSKTSVRRANTIIGHIEHMTDQVEFISRVQEEGIKVGLGLDLVTPVSDLNETIINNLDMVLLMSVPAGFGGQKFSYQVIKKIKLLSNTRKKNKQKFKIHVDGGVTSDNIKDIATAGADEVSVGRSLFKGDLRENINKFNKLLS